LHLFFFVIFFHEVSILNFGMYEGFAVLEIEVTKNKMFLLFVI